MEIETRAAMMLEEPSESPNMSSHSHSEENATERDCASQPWSEPTPLSTRIEMEPYPFDALPLTIRAAVEEVAGFVQAPMPMVVSSALATLSLACQAHIDVKRTERLEGPVGLFLLTIADSGERKSTCDGFFMKPVREYQEAQAEAMEPLIVDYHSALAAWEAEKDGVLTAIREKSKKSQPADSLRADLAELQRDKPEAPRVPRMLLGDVTPEALAWSLAKQWPSAGILSSEAGLILGSHGMGKDSAMRNLALLNVLWDGGTHSIGRRTSESYEVRGARLTVALQIQEATLREFFGRTGELARGTGFMARFFLAWPESTQGFRPFTEAPANWPNLAVYHQRIAEILNQPAPISEDGTLAPTMLTMSPDAKAAWVEYHDGVESMLARGGELHDVRDVASKSADNAARLAALFQCYAGGGVVSKDSVLKAIQIAAWHLSEARRFFGEFALPVEMADAVRLDSWLVDYCKHEGKEFAGKNHVRRFGPLRDGSRLNAAIKELDEHNRLRLVKEGRLQTIHINPVLLERAR